MKIAYLYRGRPDLKAMIPADVDSVVLDAGPGGVWEDEVLAQMKDVDAILVSTEPINEQLLAASPNLKIVQRMGVGYDNVDLEAAAKRGIPCCNLAGVNKEAVAEHGMLMILSVARQLATHHNNVMEGKWKRLLRSDVPVFELPGKTMGIVGLGNTGYELAKRTFAHGMRIVYNDIRDIDPERVKSVEAVFMEKDDLFRESDVVSINTDLNDQSRGMVDARRIGLMKPSAILVCCARGGIIDEPALRDALNEDRLAGAGIDVFGTEPIDPNCPLLSAKNVILTPHVAGLSRESMSRAYEWAHENARRAVNDQQPKWVVNGVGG